MARFFGFQARQKDEAVFLNFCSSVLLEMMNDLRFRQMASERIFCTQRIKRRCEKGDYSISSLSLWGYKITLARQVRWI